MTRLLMIVLCAAALPVALLGAEWGPPTRLTYNDSTSYMSLGNAWCVALSHETLHAVWYDRRDGNCEIYYKRSLNDGASWEADVRLTDDTAYSGYPSIAVAGRDVHVIWVDQRDHFGTDIHAEAYYKRSTDGGTTWGPDTQLRIDQTGDYGSWFPCIAADGPNLHVAWEDDRNGDDEICYRRSTNAGQTWSVEYILRTGAGTVNPSLAVAGSTVHLACYDFGLEVVYYLRSTDGGLHWEPKVVFPTPDISDSPSLAVQDSLVHVAYCDGRNGFSDVWYKRSTDAGVTWSDEVCLMPDIYQTWTTNVAVAGRNVHVVRGDMGGYQVHYVGSTDAGLTWSPERCLSESTGGGDCYHYSVAARDSTVHVVWDQRFGPTLGSYEIFTRRNPVLLTAGPESPSPAADNWSLCPNVTAGPAAIPGHAATQVTIYNTEGRRVGRATGSSIGAGLPAGVYYVTDQTPNARPRRWVKLRR